MTSLSIHYSHQLVATEDLRLSRFRRILDAFELVKVRVVAALSLLPMPIDVESTGNFRFKIFISLRRNPVELKQNSR
jgi:hypothetical protein